MSTAIMLEQHASPILLLPPFQQRSSTTTSAATPTLAPILITPFSMLLASSSAPSLSLESPSSLLSAASPFVDYEPSPPPSPRSAAAKFFAKTRSRSITQTPLASSSSSSSTKRHQPEELVAPLAYGEALPRIKSCSVPHHSKSGGKGTLFACRVVPESILTPLTTTSSSFPMMKRQGSSSTAAAGVRKKTSLGRMDIAGTGDRAESEPFTVWRRYEEFVDFSSRLQIAFPVVPSSAVAPATTAISSAAAAASSKDLPSSFYRHIPRLSKRLTLFVTRSTLQQRQQELDLFVRRLFDMPAVVRDSHLVRAFFAMRLADGCPPSPSPSSALLKDEQQQMEGVESFATFLASRAAASSTLKSPAATGAGGGSGARSFRRPRLGLKFSVPDLRRFGRAQDDDDEDVEKDEDEDDNSSAMPRPTSNARAQTTPTTMDLSSSSIDLRTSSRISISASSVSSSSTIIAPNQYSTSSPASPVYLTHINETSLSSPSPASPWKKTLPLVPLKSKKKVGPILRHFRSLQDLRQTISSSLSSPVPALPTTAASSSNSRKYDSASLPTAANSSSSFVLSARGAPKASSGRGIYHDRSRSSFEDVPLSASASSFDLTYCSSSSFRSNASGRLASVPCFPLPAAPQRQRRPSMPPAAPSARRRSSSSEHSRTESASSSSYYDEEGSGRSSGGSLEMSRTSGGARSSSGASKSRRSSAEYDYSDTTSSGYPATPPTPQSQSHPHAALVDVGEFGQVNTEKYYVDEAGCLLQNNAVPLLPFFPVPPSMSSPSLSSPAMQFYYSSDSCSSTATSNPASSTFSSRLRRPSFSGRSRTTSSASIRPPLDTIMASPRLTSATTPTLESFAEASALAAALASAKALKQLQSTTIACKVLHTATATNFVMRIAKSIKLDAFRLQLEGKFWDSAVIRLSDEAYSLSPSPSPPFSRTGDRNASTEERLDAIAENGEEEGAEDVEAGGGRGWKLAYLPPGKARRGSAEFESRDLEMIVLQEQLERAIDGSGDKITFRIV